MLKQAIAALALVLLAFALRLPRLVETPGWDGDEGYNLEIAWQLWQGRAQAFAVTQSFVQHPILFYAGLAPLLGMFGRDLGVARVFAAAIGALAAGALYIAVRASSGTRAALFAALTLAGAHFVVAHGRLAYTYNLQLLWGALTWLCVTRWEETRARRWLWGAVAGAALALLSDQVGIGLVAFVCARVWPRRRLALASGLVSVAPALLAAVLSLTLRPEAAIQDWSKSLARVGVETQGLEGGPATRVALWFVNYLHLLRAEWWVPLAIAGLFCMRCAQARRRGLTFGALIAAPVFALRELDPFFRTGIPLFIPAAMGVGALMDAALRRVLETVPGRVARAAVAALVVVLPLGLELGRSAGSAATTFQTKFDWALVTDQGSARAAADFVNARTGAEDVVLTSPHVAWLYRARTADFFQATAWGGDAIAFYPAGMSRGRFAFDPSVERARFVVVDPFWRRWEDVSEPLARLSARVQSWPEAMSAGDLSVRRNPAA